MDSLSGLPLCLRQGCSNRICLGASDLYCYPHALYDLLFSQYMTIGLHFGSLPDHIQQWYDSHDNWMHREIVEEMESMMIWLFDNEINYVSEAWIVQASEIMRRIQGDE